jgi:hypothetical protein
VAVPCRSSWTLDACRSPHAWTSNVLRGHSENLLSDPRIERSGSGVPTLMTGGEAIVEALSVPHLKSTATCSSVNPLLPPSNYAAVEL